jgi:hypothetical protein
MISLIFGRREQGKTTLAYHLILQKETRVIVDPRGQFGTTSDVLPDENGLYELLDDRSEIVIKPEREPRRVFSEVAAVCREWLRDNPGAQFAFLLDEARIFDTPSAIPEDFEYLLRMAPRDEVDVVLTAHRPSDVSVDIRAIADFWLIFQTTQEHDLRVISERCGDTVAETALTLPQHAVIIWNDAKGASRVSYDSEIWRHDIRTLPRNVQEEGERSWITA